MNLSEKQLHIISLIKEDQNITAKEIQKILDLTERDFLYEVRDLKQKGILSHVGMVNSGTWILNTTKNQN